MYVICFPDGLGIQQTSFCRLLSVDIYGVTKLMFALVVDFLTLRPTRGSMALRDSNILFDDLFTIKEIDKEGKKFDRGLPIKPHHIYQTFSLVHFLFQFLGYGHTRATLTWT